MIQIHSNTSAEEKTAVSRKRFKSKKLFAGVTACVIALGCLGGLTGCSGNSDSSSTAPDGTVSSDGDNSSNVDPAKAGLAAYSANYEITDKMFACYYQDMIAMFSQMYGEDTLLNYYQMDISKPLKDQPYPTDDGTTWFDNVVIETGNTLTQQLVLAEAGKAAGIEPPAAVKKIFTNFI